MSIGFRVMGVLTFTGEEGLVNLKMGFSRKTVKKSRKQTNCVKNKFANSQSINQDPKVRYVKIR